MTLQGPTAPHSHGSAAGPEATLFFFLRRPRELLSRKEPARPNRHPLRLLVRKNATAVRIHRQKKEQKLVGALREMGRGLMPITCRIRRSGRGGPRLVQKFFPRRGSQKAAVCSSICSATEAILQSAGVLVLPSAFRLSGALPDHIHAPNTSAFPFLSGVRCR